MISREEHLPITRHARMHILGDPADIGDLWIVCHGYGQLAGRFIRDFESVAGTGRVVVAPEGLHRYYLDPADRPAAQRRVGATWMTREDRETDIKDYVSYLDAVVDHVLSRDRARARARIRAVGFSQGAATVFRWAALGRTPIDELMLWAGEVPSDVDMSIAADRLRNTRVVVIRGLQDELASGKAAQSHSERLAAAGISYESREFEGGHRLDRALLHSLI